MPTPAPRVLEAHDLKCIRGDKELFSGLGFSIISGETLVVKGSNGSGKTSLLRIICGFSQPAAGRVTWCSEPIYGHENYRQQVSYVGHQSGVKPDLTVLENLVFMQRLAGENSKEPEIKEIVRAAGLFGQRNMMTGKLSAGQRRRLALAKLMLQQRTIWVLDEPLTALDKEFIGRFEQVLKDHLENEGILVVTTHRELKIPEHRVKRIGLS
ncbi:MAG: cytochrome c biogenesis heme-transporting ATPase CcmA [Proteobacteria bacterium]|nr:cytochrome c biogenesis heme-transporting ATPase CcmA [Pseudomonadota bacterium]